MKSLILFQRVTIISCCIRSALGDRTSRRILITSHGSLHEPTVKLSRKQLHEEEVRKRLLQSNDLFLPGDPGCPCLSVEELTENPAIETDAVIADLGADTNYTSYGVNCFDHDLDVPLCADAPSCSSVIPIEQDCEKTWCYRSFCYVDHKNCDLLNIESPYFPGRHYSYATCGEMDSFTSVDRIKSLQGQAIKVGYVSNSGGWKGSYNPDGNFADNNDWSGPLVDLMNTGAGQSGMVLVRSEPPDWLRTQSDEYFGGSSSFDFCVYAASLGYLDMCLGAFTITNTRAAVTTFFETSQEGYFLITFSSGDETAFEAFQTTFFKIFLPFTFGAWLMIIFFVIPVLGLLMLFHEYGAPGSAFYSRTKVAVTDPATGEEVVVEDDVPIQSHVRKSLYMSYLSFFAGSFDPVVVTAGGKVHLAAIASFLLLVMAVYTANLAAILTQELASTPVSSLEEALEAGYSFCATRSTVNTLVVQQGLNPNVFLNDPEELGGDGLPGFRCSNCRSRTRVFEAMSTSPDGVLTCSAALTTLEDLQVLQGAGEHCNKTEVGSILGYRSSGIPISTGIADEMLSFLYQMKFDGVLELAYQGAQPESTCPDTGGNEGSSLDINQLTGIWLLVFFIAIVALITKFTQPSLKKYMTPKTSLRKYDQWGNLADAEVKVGDEFVYNAETEELEKIGEDTDDEVPMEIGVLEKKIAEMERSYSEAPKRIRLIVAEESEYM